jgi:hypothetical protein
MKRVKVMVFCMLVFSLLGIAAYAQTVLTDIWKDKKYSGPVKKIAIFCISNYAQTRLLFENEFVHQLKERGVDAMPASVVFRPDKLVKKKEAMSKLNALGVDAVLTLRIVRKVTAHTTIPAPDSTAPSKLSGYYEYVYDTIAKEESEPAYLETSVFDIKNEQRIWTARSVTKVEVVDQKALSEFAKLMIERLVSDKMIK